MSVPVGHCACHWSSQVGGRRWRKVERAARLVDWQCDGLTDCQQRERSEKKKKKKTISNARLAGGRRIRSTSGAMQDSTSLCAATRVCTVQLPFPIDFYRFSSVSVCLFGRSLSTRVPPFFFLFLSLGSFAQPIHQPPRPAAMSDAAAPAPLNAENKEVREEGRGRDQAGRTQGRGLTGPADWFSRACTSLQSRSSASVLIPFVSSMHLLWLCGMDRLG